MKVFIDTNIILDHLLDRAPFNKDAAFIFAETERGALHSFIGGSTITTIYSLVTKTLGDKEARTAIDYLLQLFEIAPINRTILCSALKLKFKDFEDAVLHEAAHHCGVEAIITRNIKDFVHASLSIYTSEEFVASLLNVTTV